MKAEGPLHPLSEYRIRARRLLNQLRSDSEEAAARAAVRFSRLRYFSTRTVCQILEDRGRVKLKHALAVIALEHGHESWRALKASAGAGGHSASASAVWGRDMYAPKMDVFLNRWFARYEEARASLREQGGFLLPYECQFLVCGEGAIRALGLDPGDPDWDRIGRDWAKPRDSEAWRRLRRKREQILLGEVPGGGTSRERVRYMTQENLATLAEGLEKSYGNTRAEKALATAFPREPHRAAGSPVREVSMPSDDRGPWAFGALRFPTQA